MAKERTEASKYLSKYGEPGESLWVAPAQFLAETMVSKMAAKDGVKLPPRFWSGGIYKKDFLFQLKKANDILKSFPIEIVLEALSSWRCKYVYSLGLRSVIDPICKELMARKASASELQDKYYEKQQPIEVDKRENVPLYRPTYGSGGAKSKLGDL